MRSNGLLKWLTIPLVLVVVFVGFRLASDKPSPKPPSPEPHASELTPREMEALGIEGDTPEDTVATLVAQVKELRTELSEAVSSNKQQRAENERLRLRDRAIDERIDNLISKEREQWQRAAETSRAEQQQQTQTLFEELRSRLDRGTAADDIDDFPVGLGLSGPAERGMSEIHWIDPLDLRSTGEGSQANKSVSTIGEFPSSFAVAKDSAAESWDSVKATVRDAAGEVVHTSDAKPVYTVSSNATLTRAIAMTALIGRVPVDGAVVDAFPFKVIIGPDNLTANGIELPEIAGAVVSGTASGDWNLSCVRGEIKSITFVFQDGTIAGSTTSSGRGNSTSGQNNLGYISDPYGIPCIGGLKRSNAREYLSSQMLITAAGAGAASLIDSTRGNFSYVTGSNGQTLGTVGITGNEALERILAGGVQEMSQWVNKMYGQAFAAVYVPPLAKVAVHIEQPIEIDYDPTGRKVNHSIGSNHASDLD